MEKGTLKRQFFIALFPPAWISERIEALRGQGPKDWDWKQAADYHVTLAFPGRLSDRALKRMKLVLQDIVHEAFDLSFEGLGHFLPKTEGRKKRTPKHVLWARPDGQAESAIRILHNKIAGKLRKSGFKYGLQGITPHLTVAKIPEGDLDLMTAFTKAHGSLEAPSWHCDRFALCEALPGSHDDHPANNNGEGSHYRKIVEFSLKN